MPPRFARLPPRSPHERKATWLAKQKRSDLESPPSSDAYGSSSAPSTSSTPAASPAPTSPPFTRPVTPTPLPTPIIAFCDAVLSKPLSDITACVWNEFSLSDVTHVFRQLRTCGNGARPKGPAAQSKGVLIEWLVLVVRNVCKALQTNTLAHTHLLVPVRFKLCGPGGSLDSLPALLRVFDDQFTSEFMLAVMPENERALLSAFRGISNPFKSSREWPRLVSPDLKKKFFSNYREATTLAPLLVCAVCARQRRDAAMKSVCVPIHASKLPLSLDILRVSDPFLIERAQTNDDFASTHPLLQNLMLDPAGISMNSEDGSASLHICSQCHASLKDSNRRCLPKFALKNRLYRGLLPERFQNLTWIEEQVCARYRSTAYVTRLHYLNDPKHPYVLHGNTCAFEQATVATADVLPRIPADIEDSLTVVFTGPQKKIPESALKKIFRIRKTLVLDFLSWLKQNNSMYADIEIDPANLSLYGDDGSLPHLNERIIHHVTPDARADFVAEAAAFEDHPAHQLYHDSSGDDPEDPRIFLDSTGAFDLNNSDVPARNILGAALRNLQPDFKSSIPDVAMHRGSQPVSDYNNPALIPGMFPTLFPYGTAGFDDKERLNPISLQVQAEYFLDLHDPIFRRHRSFAFVVLNIHQRHTAHLHTALAVKKSSFRRLSKALSAVTPEVIASVADHLEKELPTSALPESHKSVFKLLEQVNTITTHLPGSKLDKLRIRNEIRAYMGYFGMPAIYITLNPSASHSPIFQFVWGDEAVNLADRFPDLVSSSERAIRVASDPAAGADFFDLSINAIFEELFGWDHKNACSKKEGGLLGHLSAYYGTAEYTKRGQLHGHFLIWLDGSLNPSDVHARMRDDETWRDRFFEFFEDIIHHHLPDIDTPDLSNREPRTERPPIPTDDFFEHDFEQDLKALGEHLQRHTCRQVCHEYGHEDGCRFLFPHDIVEHSSFDPKTNSIALKCLDPTCNYLNPHLLVSTRHNHDIKCILSGKAAKAAMFYISDYITKNDEKLHQVLSLFSKAAAETPRAEGETEEEHVKRLLHRCVSTLLKKQEIHAQQAVRYIRGKGDGMRTHECVPMFSRTITRILQESLPSSIPPAASDSDDPADDDDDDEYEPEWVRVRANEDCGLRTNVSQGDDYYWRDVRLHNVCFYDFVRCFRKVPLKNHAESGKYPRFEFTLDHPQCKTHCLIQRINPRSDHPSEHFIPRVLGSSIPRRVNDPAFYGLFMLAHFAPFSSSRALDGTRENVEALFDSYDFSDRARYVMKNWDAIHECEDERDAERMRKKESLSKKKREAAKKMMEDLPDDFWENLDAYDLDAVHALARDSGHTELPLLSTVRAANWHRTDDPCTIPHENEEGQHLHAVCDQNPLAQAGVWKRELTRVQKEMANARRNHLNPETQELGIAASTTQVDADMLNDASTAELAPQTVPLTNTSPKESHLEFDSQVAHLVQKYAFNEKQELAFRITAAAFRQSLSSTKCTPTEPLRIFFEGPGGTGKTYVLCALKELMAKYNREHRIRFLAPTGGAAALIDGQTIHRGLGIAVKDNTSKKAADVLSAQISANRLDELRQEWKNVEFLVVDEISMVGAELFAELDIALRYVREEHRDEFFGGVHLIASGDFYQLPAVRQRALYSPWNSTNKCSNTLETWRKWGRLAWKQVDQVVQFTEQKRMEGDPELARAVLHLRDGSCDEDDRALFNSCAIRSVQNPDGVDLGKLQTELNQSIMAIVDTNKDRHALNEFKSRALCSNHGQPLTRVSAVHTIRSKMVPHEFHKKALLENWGDKELLPTLDLYIGAPVVLRGHPNMQDLRITNGLQGEYGCLRMVQCGTLRYLKTEPLYDDSEQQAVLAIVEFPDSNVHLPGLPRGYFPLRPLTHSVEQKLIGKDGKPVKMYVTRSQLPLQLAFAVTAHSAQGKTLPCVLADMHMKSGPARYVAVSRARNRKGLTILRPVSSLAELNKMPHEDLRIEMERINALAHNTTARHCPTRHLSLIPIPEHSLERAKIDLRAEFEVVREKKEAAQPKKRKAETHGTNATLGADHSEAGPDRKRRRIKDTPSVGAQVGKAVQPATNLSGELSPTRLPGCRWDSRDYSCAYDAALIPMIYALRESSVPPLDAATSPLLAAVLDLARNAPASLSQSFLEDSWRAPIRNLLRQFGPTQFPNGPTFVSVSLLCSFLVDHRLPSAHVSLRCDNCASVFAMPRTYSLGSEVTVDAVNMLRQLRRQGPEIAYSDLRPNIPWTDWLLSAALIAHSAQTTLHNHICHYCSSTGPFQTSFIVTAPPPPFLFFTVAQFTVRPPNVLDLLSSIDGLPFRFRLFSGIYYAHSHFTSRYFDSDGTSWAYDSQRNNGYLLREAPPKAVDDALDGAQLCLVAYVLRH